MTPSEKYIEALNRYAARDDWSEGEEDELLDELDELWWALDNEEREKVEKEIGRKKMANLNRNRNTLPDIPSTCPPPEEK
jgi:hypothetical protein